jgi:membrane associated rhomboid family serine protease
MARDAVDEHDYLNHPMPRWAYRGPAVRSVTFWLIAVNVAVFVIDRLLFRAGHFNQFILDTPNGPVTITSPILFDFGHFSAVLAIRQWEIWRFVTFQFIHANADHLIFNMIALFFFGPMVEGYLTSRLFLPFYLLSGIGVAGMYIVLLLMGWRIGNPYVPLVGASAGIFGLLIAAASIAPDSIALVMGIIPMRLRTLAYFFILYAIFTVLFRGSDPSANAGGEAAHLGGAAVGYLLLEWPELLERLAWGGRRAPPF